MELSIIIPAYDEARKIRGDVEAAGVFLQAHTLSGEIIVVDDGSTDGTAEVAGRAILPTGIPLTVISHDVQTGKGAAVRTGVLRSRGTYVMFADAGLTVPYDNALTGLSLLRAGTCALAHGSRWMSGSRIRRPQDPWRQWISRIVRVLILQLLRLPRHLTDTQCGFKVYAGDIARALFAHCRTDHFLFDVEVLVRALQQGYRVEEFPVDWSCDRDSRLSIRRHAREVITDLLVIRRLSRRTPSQT
jgi:dolichyl-phosphate beta-glucosyltransferase